MNKNLLLVGGAIVVGASILGFMMLNKKPATELAGNNTGSVEEKMMAGDNQTFSGSFKELMALGENYTCQFDNTDDTGNNTKGTVYIADKGKRMNGAFTITAANSQPHDAYVINDGEYSYVWTSLQAQGYKSKIDPEDNSLFPSDGKSDKKVGFDEDQAMDINCRKWNPAADKFVPPSNIDFIDFSAQMEMMLQQSGANSGAMMQGNSVTDGETSIPDDGSQCAACNNAPAGAAREQCLTALGC